ncbi:MAG: hypothetical protein ACLUQK_10615 [Clostridium sp.]
MHGGSGVTKHGTCRYHSRLLKVNYYSYMATATSKHISEYLNERDGKAFWHEVEEESYRFMKEYAKDVLTVFKNGK